eukprot:TRINITY_DN2044_c5_g1_i1.p1 TRINITY_DN2044_c5_g1~~TRINITY_DN2044_c5_g1_i1.p1  ORF type:complete len:510 (+),score=129.63 TRINITY_DN2044_c5_g1_i1:82-1611(+)
MSRRKGGADPRDQFWAAVESQKMDTLRWCLSNATGLLASTQNDEGLTSFMVAAKGGKWKSMQMLIDFYARSKENRPSGWVECTDENGKTALMMAAEEGSVKCVDFLLDAQPQGRGENRGVNAPTLGPELLKQKDRTGKTAFDYAKNNRRKDVVSLIEDFLRPPSEDEAVADDPDGISSTQKSKAKKRALAAQSGGDMLSQHKEQDAAHLKKVEEERAATAAAEAIQKRDRPPVWPEIAKVDSTADKSSKICEVSVIRDSPGSDCPAHGDAANPCDPALWDLAMLNRLTLKLPKGMLTQLPSAIGRLTALQVLVVSGNALSKLPDELSTLPQLKILEAQDNNLTELPSALSKCTKLQVVKVGRNQITSLEPMSGLTELTIVHADGNKLDSMDGLNFEKLSRLSELCLSNNAIDEISDEIGCCPVLASIKMAGCSITSIPGAITQLKKVKELNLDNNPLKDNKVKKYLDQGGKGLKDLWKYLEKNAKKGGGGKKNKKKKKVVSESEDEDED